MVAKLEIMVISFDFFYFYVSGNDETIDDIILRIGTSFIIGLERGTIYE